MYVVRLASESERRRADRDLSDGNSGPKGQPTLQRFQYIYRVPDTMV